MRRIIRNIIHPYYASVLRDQILPEQEITLRNLAEKAARDGMRILEIGSWCGCSSVILGRVARAIMKLKIRFGTRQDENSFRTLRWWNARTGYPTI